MYRRDQLSVSTIYIRTFIFRLRNLRKENRTMKISRSGVAKICLLLGNKTKLFSTLNLNYLCFCSSRRTNNLFHSRWWKTFMSTGDSKYRSQRFLITRNQCSLRTFTYLLFTLYKRSTWRSEKESSSADERTVMRFDHSDRCRTSLRQSTANSRQRAETFGKFSSIESIRTFIFD